MDTEALEFVSCSPLALPISSSSKTPITTQNVIRTDGSAWLDLLNSAQVPPGLQKDGGIDLINWCVQGLQAISSRQGSQLALFDSTVLSTILSMPGALPLVQIIVQTIENRLSRSQEPLSELYSLLSSIHWPQESNICMAVSICSISLANASVAIPCIIHMCTPGSYLIHVLSYLSQYFSTVLSSSLHSLLERHLEAPSSSPSASLPLPKLDHLLAILSEPIILRSSIQEWAGSRSELAQMNELGNFVLSIADLPISDSNSISNPILPLIIEEANEIQELFVHIAIAAAKKSTSEPSEHRFFILLTERFFKGLIGHICRQSSKVIPCLRSLVHSAPLRKAMAQERYLEWLHFEMVASQYPLCDDTPIHSSSTSSNFSNDTLKRMAPVIDLTWEQLEPIFANRQVSGPTSSNGAREGDLTTESSGRGIGSWTLEEISTLLKNILFAIESSNCSFASKLPMDWFLSLMDQFNLQIMWLSVFILEKLIDKAPIVKLHLFASNLIEYFESLCLAHHRRKVEEELSKNHSYDDEESQRGSQSMDVDKTARPEAKLLEPPNSQTKLLAVRCLFSGFRNHPQVLNSIISDIVHRLCNEQFGDSLQLQLPAWHEKRSNASLSESVTMDTSAFPESLDGSVGNMDAESDPSQVLINVRRRARNATALAPSSKRQTPLTGPAIGTNLRQGPDIQNTTKESSLRAKVDLIRLVDLLLPLPRSGSSPASHQEMMGVIKFMDSLLIEIDGRLPPVSNYEVYMEILPKKSLFDRDRGLEQLFLQIPSLWSMLELIASRSSAHHPLLFNCRHILLSMLVNLIGNWNAETKANTSESQWFAPTMTLMGLIERKGFGLLDKSIAGVQIIFEYCQPSEITVILTGIFHHISRRLLPRNVPTEERMWVMQPIRYVLRKNIHILSEKALHLYIRMKSPSKS